MSPTGALMVVLGVFIIARLVTKDSHNETLAGRLVGGQPKYKTITVASTGAQRASTSAAVASGGTSLHVQGSVTPQLLERVGRRFGWNAAEDEDWEEIIADESGGDPNIVNSSTTAAYGIGQFFNPAPGNPILPRAEQIARNKQKYIEYGGTWRTVIGQLIAMGNYIKRDYGTPASALAHENSGGGY